MQFTVLIEFLVPGLATTLLLLSLWPDGAVLRLPHSFAGETASALLLLAVSYPVGILTNYPLFAIQKRLVSNKARERVIRTYEERGLDLVELVTKQCGLTRANLPTDPREQHALLCYLMSAFVFSKNIDRLRSNHSYHEGLQRLARGILPPLLLASYVVYRYQTPKWGLLIGFLLGLALSACFLVRHSVRVEYDQMVRYFLVLTHLESSVTAKAIPGART